MGSQHDPTDLDSSVFAGHHSLGPRANQAAAGNHKHHGTILFGTERISVTRNGAVFANNTAGQDAGQYAVSAAAKGSSTRCMIKATVNAWASANQDAQWNLQYQLGAGAFGTIDQVYRQNNGIAQQSLGATLIGWIDYPSDSTVALNFRLTADIAAGGVTVTEGGTNFSAWFFGDG